MEYLLVIGLCFLAYLVSNKTKTSKKYPNYRQYIKTNNFSPKTKKDIKQTDFSKMKLSDEQKKIFDILENTLNHVFITGKAGTGKSVLLQYFKYKTFKKVVVCAPTGVAAINVGGQTINSLFKIPPSFIEKDSLKIDEKTANLLKNITAVVIDEVSMVRADLMDAIDSCLRQARGINHPFGGAQIIMFGDVYQLPPVVNDSELLKYFNAFHGGPYFFNADVWQRARLNIYELSHIFRQKDNDFKEILNSVRVGDINQNVLSKINGRLGIEIPKGDIVTLATTNKIVTEINSSKLSSLSGNFKEYRASIVGFFEENSFPTEEVLRLKVGAQVMMLKNDKEKRWVNGTVGHIHSLSDNEIVVSIKGIRYSIAQETWNKIKYHYNHEKHTVEEEIVSSFTQYPMRLAWAITIHKSQGQTYDSAIIDIGNGAFAHGQTYVALSRCRSFDGVYLKRPIHHEDIIVDHSIADFMGKSEILKI